VLNSYSKARGEKIPDLGHIEDLVVSVAVRGLIGLL